MNNFLGGIHPVRIELSGYLSVWNVLVFLIYGWDKLCAKKHWRRIPESVLLGFAFLMGAFGAMFGMVIWNHKTSKAKFRFLVPLFIVLQFVLCWLDAKLF